MTQNQYKAFREKISGFAMLTIAILTDIDVIFYLCSLFSIIALVMYAIYDTRVRDEFEREGWEKK